MLITYLYAKQHNVTGLRYFGKTTRNPYKYKGSGKSWKKHLAKYGNDVTTTWVQAYTDLDILTTEALFFSKVYNIVLSREWANIKDEDGLMGGPTVWKTGKEHHMYGKKRPEHSAKLKGRPNPAVSAALKGRTAWNSGKTLGPRPAQSEAMKLVWAKKKATKC